MLTRPASLLKQYKPFRPVGIDYLNVVTGALLDEDRRKKRWYEKFKRLLPGEVSIDLGAMAKPITNSIGLEAPALKGTWNLKLENEIKNIKELDRFNQAKIYQESQSLQKTIIEGGNYALNIKLYQTGNADTEVLDVSDLNAKPLTENHPDHGQLIVVDAALDLDEGKDSELNLCDYPPFLRKPSDDTIRLQLSDVLKTKLKEYDVLKTGWHPYCRVFGIYNSLGGEVFIEPLTISLREIDAIPQSIFDELKSEWEKQHYERKGIVSLENEFHKHLVLMKTHIESEIVPKIPLDLRKDHSAKLNAFLRQIRLEVLNDQNSGPFLNGLKAFEDEIFSGPMSFVLGLWHFLETYNDSKLGEIAENLIFQVRALGMPFAGGSRNDYKSALDYLEPLKIPRFGRQAIDRLAPFFDGSKLQQLS